MRRIVWLLAIFALKLPLVAADRISHSDHLAGKVIATTYTAPKDLFFVEAPPVVRPFGFSLEDCVGNVTFLDGDGGVYRIDYLEMSPDLVSARAKLGDKSFFEEFLSSTYLPNTIWLSIPKAAPLRQSFSIESVGPILKLWMFLPQGARYSAAKKTFKPKVPDDSYRSIAVFIKKQVLFVVSVAPSESQFYSLYKDKPEQLQVALGKNLLVFAEGIHISKRPQ